MHALRRTTVGSGQARIRAPAPPSREPHLPPSSVESTTGSCVQRRWISRESGRGTASVAGSPARAARQVSSAHPSLLSRRIRFNTVRAAGHGATPPAHVKGIDAEQCTDGKKREALLTASGTSIPSSAGVTGAQQALRSQHWPLLQPAGLLSSSTGGTGSTRMLRLSPTPWHSGPQLPNSFHASSAGGGLHGSKTRSRAQEQIRLVPSAVCTTFEPTPATSMRAAQGQTDPGYVEHACAMDRLSLTLRGRGKCEQHRAA